MSTRNMMSMAVGLLLARPLVDRLSTKRRQPLWIRLAG